MKQIKTFFVRFITYIFAVLFAGSLAANAEIKVVTTIKPLHSLISNVMDGVGEPSLIIEEILIVGIMFFVIYLKGFSVAID